MNCKCVGAAHYDTHAYRICPWGAECYGVRYTRSSVSESSHVTSERRYSTDIGEMKSGVTRDLCKCAAVVTRVLSW